MLKRKSFLLYTAAALTGCSGASAVNPLSRDAQSLKSAANPDVYCGVQCIPHYTYNGSVTGTNGIRGSAGYNDLSSIAVAGSQNSSTCSSTASFSSNATTYSVTHNNFTIAGYGSKNFSYSAPLLNPGGSGTLTGAGVAPVQIATSDTEILATATVQVSQGTLVVTVSSADSETFTFQVSLNSQTVWTSNIVLSSAISEMHNHYQDRLAYAPSVVNDGSPVEVATAPCCKCNDYAAGSAGIFAFVLGLFSLGPVGGFVFGALSGGVGGFGVGVWILGKRGGC